MSKTLSAEAEHKPYFTTKRMALIGVMTAVTCILGPFSIPLPFSPVPISFTNLAIYLAAYVLGMKACTVSYLIYMLLGMVGVPVFSGFTAGVGKLAGPTGGYLVGFILMALIVRQSALQIRQIDHADVRNSSHVHIHHIIHGKTASVHAVKRLLHTVLADADIVRNTDHLSRNMFRASTDIADVLILRVLIPVCVIRSGTLCHLSGA